MYLSAVVILYKCLPPLVTNNKKSTMKTLMWISIT